MEALVKPLLKKVQLDLLDRNCRPVSNVWYVSKHTEHAAATQVGDHIGSHGLMENHQSAYCALHSMEAALLEVKNDVIKTLKTRKWHVLSFWIFLQPSIPSITTHYSAEWKPSSLLPVSL